MVKLLGIILGLWVWLAPPSFAQNWQSAGAVSVPVSGVTGQAVIANALVSNVNLNNTANFIDGPTIAQGSVGTWFVIGTVTVYDSAVANISCKLWDGTTVIASTTSSIPFANDLFPVTLGGVITAPAGNLRISCKDVTTVNGAMWANQSGAGKDSAITAYRIN